MDATEYRLINFLTLFKEFREEKPDLPNRGMLKRFGEHIDLSDRYLSHVKCGRKQIGAATARQIESKMGKPHGWLDLPHGASQPENTEERFMVEQMLVLYRNSPDLEREMLADALRIILN